MLYLGFLLLFPVIYFFRTSILLNYCKWHDDFWRMFWMWDVCCCWTKIHSIIAGLIKHHHQTPIQKQNGHCGFKPKKFGESSSAEEEFFCLTPEDARSISSNTSDRSRNASTASGHQIPDSKIFSVAVEAKAKEPHSGRDSMMVCDVDTDYTGRFAVVSSEKTPKRIAAKQMSKESKIEENNDQVVSSLPEVRKQHCLCTFDHFDWILRHFCRNLVFVFSLFRCKIR